MLVYEGLTGLASLARVLVDGILHGMVEKDPPESLRKFVKYNLPKIVKEIARKRKS